MDTNPFWSRGRHVKFFSNRCVSLQVDPIISTFARSPLSFPTLFVSSVPKLPLFSRPPTLFFKDLDFLIKYPFYWCEVSSFFSFNVLIRWFPMKILTKLQVYHSSFFFFSGRLNSSLQCWSHSFPCFKCFLMPVYLLIIHLFLFMLSGVLKLSQKIRISIPNPFKLSWGCYLFWAI